MGSEASAEVFFGIILPAELIDDDPYYWDRVDEMNNQWDRENGPPEPTDTDGGKYSTPEWDRWREERAKWISTSPRAVVLSHCGRGPQIPYICCTALLKSVFSDEHLELNLLKMFNDGKQPEYREALRDFCEKFNLPWSEPNWHLVASYE